MQNNVGKSGNTSQAGRMIEVGNNRVCSLVAPERALRRVAQQGEDLIVAKQTRQGAAGNVSAPNDQ